MSFCRLPGVIIVAVLLLLGGCATRPINPPITQIEPNGGYGLQTRQKHFKNLEQGNLVILAFSGGGTRAAAFSYGVLEFLRRNELVAPNGARIRLLDTVNVITGVSGGSFTALAYGLYGDKLFDLYETAFLKRDVQGELIARAFNPGNWGDLSSTGWGRSELAAQLYDEILFKGATLAISIAATDRSSWRRRPTSRMVAEWSSTSPSSIYSARTSMPCDSPAPPRRHPPCLWCSRPSRSTTMAEPATTSCRHG